VRSKLRRDAADAYQNDLTIWALLAPHMQKSTDPPTRPAILATP
jgi:hypothetical protein